MDGIAPKQRINALVGKYKYPILVALVGLGLMLLPSPGNRAETPTVSPQQSVQTLEQRLEEMLSGIDGAGQVRVLLTEKAGQQTLCLEHKSHFSMVLFRKHKAASQLKIKFIGGEDAVFVVIISA